MVTKASSEYTEFGDGLEGATPYTVFAPTDDAFKLIEGRLLELAPEELYRTLLFHFYEDVVMTYDTLDCSTKLTSLTGDTSRTKCRRKSAGVYVKNQRGQGNTELDDYPRIDIMSKEACAGIVHRIDHVMLPIVFKPFEDLVVDVVESDEDAIIVNADAETDIDEDEEESAEKEKPVGENKKDEKPDTVENNEPLIIAEKEDEITDYIDEEPEETGSNDAETEDPEIPSEVLDDETISQANQQPRSGPSIGALGINLIIFSTLLLCFVFVCMRR